MPAEMDASLFAISLLFAPIAGAVALFLKPKERFVMLGIGIGIGCLAIRCLIALYATTRGIGFIEYFLTPVPDWKSLATISAIFGVIVVILVKLSIRKAN